MTEYVVLVREEETSWMLLDGIVRARSAKDAIKAKGATQNAVYVAVPARSWKPLTVSVETKTELKFS